MNNVYTKSIVSKVECNHNHNEQVVKGNAEILGICRETRCGVKVFGFPFWKGDKIDVVSVSISFENDLHSMHQQMFVNFGVKVFDVE